MKKPNCYKCKYRGTIPGDTHSCCNHPVIKDDYNNPIDILLGMLGKHHKLSITDLWKKLNIRGNTTV